jgi:hypothetical protein
MQPSTFTLYQNYPNPFNPSTTIAYSITAPGLVVLKIFDINGREIQTLVNQYQPAGQYKLDFDTTSLASGVYFYKMFVNSAASKTKKMVLLR